MTTFFTAAKPKFYSERDCLQREEKDDVSGKATLNDWIRGAPNAANARVFIGACTMPNGCTGVNSHDVDAYIKESGNFYPLLSKEDLYILELLEKHGLHHYRVYKYIRMFANVNGFLVAGQVALAKERMSSDQPCLIRMRNPTFTFLIRDDETTVQCIEESDIVLNPTHEHGEGETIAKLRVVSTISVDTGGIQHILDSVSLIPYSGKTPQCTKYFGDTRSVVERLIITLKKMLMQFITLFSTKREPEQQEISSPQSPLTSFNL